MSTITETIKQGLERCCFTRPWVDKLRLLTRPTRVYFILLRMRLRIMRAYFPNNAARYPLASCRYILAGTELDNFTYEISNHHELALFIAASVSIPVSEAMSYIRELEDDRSFREEIEVRMRQHLGKSVSASYGRRVGWYCVVRALKPSLMMETGVHNGLGSSVLLQALERNSREGVEGRLIGIDNNPSSGWLVPPRLRNRLTLIIEDSATAVPRIARGHTVDLFIHDSDHAREHEMNEFVAIRGALPPKGVILSDNAHATDALSRFSEREGRRFLFWRERPLKHFYPGAGIGISLPPLTTSLLQGDSR